MLQRALATFVYFVMRDGLRTAVHSVALHQLEDKRACVWSTVSGHASVCCVGTFKMFLDLARRYSRHACVIGARGLEEIIVPFCPLPEEYELNLCVYVQLGLSVLSLAFCH